MAHLEFAASEPHLFRQMSTIQLDFTQPERFDLTYVGADNAHHRPIMIHRALLGSLERFFGILIEHYAGAFPLWLAPVQAVLVPVTEKHREYAHEVDVRDEMPSGYLDDGTQWVKTVAKEATVVPA